MSDRVRAILDSARDLSESELELVIDGLSERLEAPTGDSNGDDELEAELNRRAAECARDPCVAIPWSEFNWDEPD